MVAVVGRGGVLKVLYNGLKRGSGYKPRERTFKFVFSFQLNAIIHIKPVISET